MRKQFGVNKTNRKLMVEVEVIIEVENKMPAKIAGILFRI